MKASQASILNYLLRHYPRFVSVPELIQECRQSDVRKRVSELRRQQEGFVIEKERNGRFVAYRAEEVRRWE